jgi:hypothetical protein
VFIGSGAVTAAGGLAALFFPRALLRLAFGVPDEAASTIFFVRHWGVLIFAIGALVAYGTYDAPIRGPVLIAAAVEKAAIVALIFFGPIRRTPAMTAIALADGTFAALYVLYLLAGF